MLLWVGVVKWRAAPSLLGLAAPPAGSVLCGEDDGLGMVLAVRVAFGGPGTKPNPQMCLTLVFKEGITALWWLH